MFGVFRITLALIVVTSHLLIGPPSSVEYAVFGFYVISGYLMTLIMHENYGYTAAGRTKFALNRSLRLYPQYWAAAGISVLLITVMGDARVGEFHPVIVLPRTWPEILSNLSIVFPAWNPMGVTPRLVPPTWSLGVEIFFYALICFGISKSFGRVKVWLALSILYMPVSIMLGMPAADRYTPVAAASLPFAVGAATYFLSKDETLYNRYQKVEIPAKWLFALFLANLIVGFYILRTRQGLITEIAVYINIFLCALLVYSMAHGAAIVKIAKSTDKWIGDFSYPLYLLQWQVYILVIAVIYREPFREFSARGVVSYLLTLLISSGLAYGFIRLIDKPIENLRNRIRTRQRDSSIGEGPAPEQK